MKTATAKQSLLQLDSGEKLEYRPGVDETNDGVMTDAGLIPWDWVEGFWSFHKPTAQWMFIPV